MTHYETSRELAPAAGAAQCATAIDRSVLLISACYKYKTCAKRRRCPTNLLTLDGCREVSK